MCLSLLASNWLALNFTVICMFKENGTDEQMQNGTMMPMFNANQQGWLFTGAMVGRVFGTPPISLIISRIGFRYSMLVYGFISTFATLLTPIAVNYGGFFPLLFLQFLHGIAISIGWSGAGVISSSWSPPNTYGMFLSALTLNFQLGPVITMPLAAAICSSDKLGWPIVYYFLGTITLIFSAIFFLFYRDSPREQRYVSKSELALIESKELCSNDCKISRKIPYKAIFTDLVIWAQLCVHITRNMGYMIPLVYGAIYFNKALGVKLSTTGVTAAFPFLVSIGIKLVGGALSDRMKCISEKGRVRIFTSIQYLAALCYLLIALLPKFGITNLTWMELCFVGITASLVLSLIGAAKCTQMVACQFAHVIFAWQYFLTSAIFLVIPVGISWAAPNNSVDEWALIFMCSGVSLTLGATVFNLTLRVEPRPWTGMDFKDGSTDVKNSKSDEEMKEFLT
uniref:Major facilitator superfamily (MFS) profile domain-containing protein n=1 Tax=Globodera rostochiensis TaxID=31243 RepID=A0A914H5U4_GLORO